MNLTAFYVLIALAILPTIAAAVTILVKRFTSGETGVDSLLKPSKSLKQLSQKGKWLFYRIAILYFMLFFAAMCWVGYEFNLELSLALGINEQFALFSVVAMFIIMSVYMVIIVKRTEQIRKRLPPPPGTGSSEKEIVEYQNLAYDESTRSTTQFFTRHTRLLVAIIISGFVIIPLVMLIVIVIGHLIE
jgi:hypothetical protein